MKIVSVAVLFAAAAACAATPIGTPAPVYGPPPAGSFQQPARFGPPPPYRPVMFVPSPAAQRSLGHWQGSAMMAAGGRVYRQGPQPQPQQFRMQPQQFRMQPQQYQQQPQHYQQQPQQYQQQPQQYHMQPQLYRMQPQLYRSELQGVWRYNAPLRAAPLREDEVPHQGLGATDSVTMPEMPPFDPLLVTGPAASRFVQVLAAREPHFFPDFPHSRLVLGNQQKRLDNGLPANRLGSIRLTSDFLRGD